jgi:His-Xaa-Ser system protein HxsD
MSQNHAEDGVWFVKVNAAAYGLSAIGKAVRKFQDRLYVHIERRGDINELRLVQVAPCESKGSLAGEFFTEVLSQELRERVAREMADIRRMLTAQPTLAKCA